MRLSKKRKTHLGTKEKITDKKSRNNKKKTKHTHTQTQKFKKKKKKRSLLNNTINNSFKCLEHSSFFSDLYARLSNEYCYT